MFPCLRCITWERTKTMYIRYSSGLTSLMSFLLAASLLISFCSCIDLGIWAYVFSWTLKGAHQTYAIPDASSEDARKTSWKTSHLPRKSLEDVSLKKEEIVLIFSKWIYVFQAFVWEVCTSSRTPSERLPKKQVQNANPFEFKRVSAMLRKCTLYFQVCCTAHAHMLHGRRLAWQHDEANSKSNPVW